MDIITEIEKRLAMIEGRLESLEYRPRTCSCKCHKPGGCKFDRVEYLSTSSRRAVPCCDCPLVLL